MAKHIYNLGEHKSGGSKVTLLVAILAIAVSLGSAAYVYNNSAVGAGTRMPNGLSADSTSPSAGEVRGTTLTITGAQTLSGATTLSSTLSVAGATTLATTTVDGRVTYSLPVNATTSVSSTLNENDLLYYGWTEVTANTAADVALTLPATSTLTTFLANAGECAEWKVQNATSTAGIDLSIVAGTGIDLEYATSSSAVSLLMVGPGDSMTLEFCRESNSDITAFLTRYDDAD